MWANGWRDSVWNELQQPWDIIVIGGGITGAGVFRSAVAKGYKTLLVDASDFSFGTSSKSSKLIHGGFRYLRNKQFNVTYESVHEREWLLREARELITPLGFLMPYYQDRRVRDQFALGVILYDLMAPKWKHAHYSREKIARVCPQLDSPNLGGGYLYYDAQMDDSRVVISLIRQAVRSGGTALNYAKVDHLLNDQTGRVCGVALTDQAGSLPDLELNARVVINAAGPWSDSLREQLGAQAKLRCLRGSHLIFAQDRLPLAYAVTLLHPKDHRAMFAIPWEGTTLVGTTDLDHRLPLGQGEPFATEEEIDYILEATNATFPEAGVNRGDILSSFAGLRPVISTGKANPSQESRAHGVWSEHGLITITGGKFTTFRIMAEDALREASAFLERKPGRNRHFRYFDPIPSELEISSLPQSRRQYLLGRYGDELQSIIEAASGEENVSIDGLPNTWSELRYNARQGGIVHLDDLLLRRVRIGLLLPDGGFSLMPKVRQVVQGELGWNDQQWLSEETRYRSIYDAFYAPLPAGRYLTLTKDSHVKDKMHPTLV